MADPLEKMLLDNEPNVPFAFNWVADDWEVKWTGEAHVKSKHLRSDSIIFKQYYPSPQNISVLCHYQFLSRFFKHPNYITINKRPIFFVYDYFKYEPILRILHQYRIYAKNEGYPDLYIVRFSCLHEHAVNTNRLRKVNITDGFDEDMYYPGCSFHRPRRYYGNRLPKWCRHGKGTKEVLSRPVFLGVVTSFDNTPRRVYERAYIWKRNHTKNYIPEYIGFENDLTNALRYIKCCGDHITNKKNLSSTISNNSNNNTINEEPLLNIAVLNAWNEWGEGMAMEPSNIYGRKFLEAVPNAKRRAKLCQDANDDNIKF